MLARDLNRAAAGQGGREEGRGGREGGLFPIEIGEEEIAEEIAEERARRSACVAIRACSACRMCTPFLPATGRTLGLCGANLYCLGFRV